MKNREFRLEPCHQLRGNVQVSGAPALARAQRPRRHVEVVQICQTERVRGDGCKASTNALENYTGTLAAVMSYALAVHMCALAIHRDTRVLAVARLMTDVDKHRVILRSCFFPIGTYDNDVLPCLGFVRARNKRDGHEHC